MATSIRTRRCVWHFRAALAVFVWDHADYRTKATTARSPWLPNAVKSLTRAIVATSASSQHINGPCGSTPIAHALACCKLWGSPRTGGGGANLGMHDETPCPRGGLHFCRPSPQMGLHRPHLGLIHLGLHAGLPGSTFLRGGRWIWTSWRKSLSAAPTALRRCRQMRASLVIRCALYMCYDPSC